MNSIEGSGSQKPFFPPNLTFTQIELPEAREKYENTIKNPQDHYAEVGILTPKGDFQKARLGKNEEYGKHRVGSVTKIFTTFLALKLIKDKLLPNGLNTKCKEVLPDTIFEELFEDPEAARNMTLEQLLSHTSGLEYDDHCRKQQTPCKTMQERFLLEATKDGRKYKHTSKPGDSIGLYSNAGYAIAGWMLEEAYNKYYNSSLSFSQIMEKELFENVFQLNESSIEPGPNQDIIQFPVGDMKSSVADLLKVASYLQKGENSLETSFGLGWQSTMLRPRDLLQHHGLGCEPNARFIQHAGLNREIFGLEERDITALVIFPLKPNDPGLVAMCDSSALGPSPQEQLFIKTLKESAGVTSDVNMQTEPKYDLDFFCPTEEKQHLYHGNAYLATDVDPFAETSPESITCSRNGMKHVLVRNPKIDQEGIRGYNDENGKTWLVIMRKDGRRAIYSDYCLVTQSLEIGNLAAMQPAKDLVHSLQGVYQTPDEDPTYTFTEKNGHLYLREGEEQYSFPCLFIPDEKGGKWVASNPSGREIQFRFPKDLQNEFLLITDVLNDIPQLPDNCKRVSG